MMNIAPTHHLAWSYKHALETPRALAIPNADRASRLAAAVRCVALIPTTGIPQKISALIDEIVDDFCCSHDDKTSNEVISFNVGRIRSWKRREEAIEKIIEICIGIVEAKAAHAGQSRFLTDNEKEGRC